MIKTDKEYEVACETCGKKAIRREVIVQHEGEGGHIVVYETHAQGVNTADHLAALNRMDNFFAKVHKLQGEFKSLQRDEKILERGFMTNLDFGGVMPDACNVRTMAIPFIEIRAYGLIGEVKLSPKNIDDITWVSILTEVIEKAPEVVDRLLEIKERGLY